MTTDEILDMQIKLERAYDHANQALGAASEEFRAAGKIAEADKLQALVGFVRDAVTAGLARDYTNAMMNPNNVANPSFTSVGQSKEKTDEPNTDFEDATGESWDTYKEACRAVNKAYDVFRAALDALNVAVKSYYWSYVAEGHYTDHLGAVNWAYNEFREKLSTRDAALKSYHRVVETFSNKRK